MALQQQKQPPAHPPQPDHRQLHAEIGKQVMLKLGQPTNLLTVQVRPLWDNHYRVNVLLGPDSISSMVAHSFFLIVDAEGNVVSSAPKIKKTY